MPPCTLRNIIEATESLPFRTPNPAQAASYESVDLTRPGSEACLKPLRRLAFSPGARGEIGNISPWSSLQPINITLNVQEILDALLKNCHRS